MVHSLSLSIDNTSHFQTLLSKYFQDKQNINIEEFFKKLGIDKEYLDQLAYYQAMEKDVHT